MHKLSKALCTDNFPVFVIGANVLDILKRHKLILSLNAVRRIEETLVEDNRIITDPLYYVYKEMAITDDPQ